jgi:hypothetical protein
MTNTNFGGIGVFIMTYREQLELEHEQVDTLIDQIGDRGKVIADLHGELSKSLAKVIGSGDLKKFTAKDYGAGLAVTLTLVDQVNAEIQELGKLQGECRLALERAKAAMPAYAAFVTNGRHDTVPGRTFFLAGKAETSRFEPPTPRQSPVDPRATLSDVQLSRRFQR